MYQIGNSGGKAHGSYIPHLTSEQVLRLKRFYNQYIKLVESRWQLQPLVLPSGVEMYPLVLLFIDNNNDAMILSKDCNGETSYTVDWGDWFESCSPQIITPSLLFSEECPPNTILLQCLCLLVTSLLEV